MVKVLKFIGRMFVVLGLCLFVRSLYVQLRYYAVMPRDPDPATGRVYPYTATRSRVYVTKEEAERGQLAEILGPFGVLEAALVMALLRWADERKP
jgi:hypothetical protein